MKILRDHPLTRYTTFAIGGPANYFIEASTSDEMARALRFCKESLLPFFILGKGSNVLISDTGYRGCVILNKIDFLNTDGKGTFTVGAGYSFSLFGSQTARHGWSGLEFACGIPGSVGGAVYMNAGASQGETATHLTSVEFIDLEGALHTIPRKDLHFTYRTSPFQKMKGAIVSATFCLKQDAAARGAQKRIINYRVQTQPYNAKSAGCVFRNPQGAPSAGALIEQCGLKGTSIGGAAISTLHANFIINCSNATAADILALINHVKMTVKTAQGIDLETEILLVPSEGDLL